MSTTVAVVVSLTILLVMGFVLGWIIGRQRSQIRDLQGALDEANLQTTEAHSRLETSERRRSRLLDMREQVVDVVENLRKSPRCQIEIIDWREEGVLPDMSWRWVVTHADYAPLDRLSVAVGLTTEIPDRQPLMLGNEPTQFAALVRAVGWVEEQYGTHPAIVIDGSTL